MNATQHQKLVSLAREFAELLAEEIVETVVAAVERKLMLPAAPTSAPAAPAAKSTQPAKAKPRGGYTKKEAAEYLGVSSRSIEHFLQRKLLRKSKALRDVRIPAKDVESFYERTS